MTNEILNLYMELVYQTMLLKSYSTENFKASTINSSIEFDELFESLSSESVSYSKIQ